MQRFRRSLVDGLFTLRSAAQRVCSSGGLATLQPHAAGRAVAEPWAAAFTTWGSSAAMSSSLGAALASSRGSPLAATAAGGGAAPCMSPRLRGPLGWAPFSSSSHPVPTKSDKELTKHQALKRLLRPKNSGRNRFKLKWQKQLQIKARGPAKSFLTLMAAAAAAAAAKISVAHH